MHAQVSQGAVTHLADSHFSNRFNSDPTGGWVLLLVEIKISDRAGLAGPGNAVAADSMSYRTVNMSLPGRILNGTSSDMRAEFGLGQSQQLAKYGLVILPIARPACGVVTGRSCQSPAAIPMQQLPFSRIAIVSKIVWPW